METVAAFFGGNPFGTPVGQRIEQATDSSLTDENWALNMEICDLINEMEEGPKDAIRALRKRFQLNAGKNHTVILNTLIVLETCVKNCGRRFHVLVCTKEFIQELVKLIGPKNDPPIEIQEKVLTLIQSWSDAFQQHPDLQGVTQVYQELKSKGIEFPMTNLDTMAPILTPQRAFEPAAPTPSLPQRPSTAVDAVMIETDESPAVNQQITLTAEKVTKLKRELEVVEGNMSVLSEMLAELTPGQESTTDLELLRDLYVTCRTMQVRLVELLDRVANDQLTAHLLKINDDLNNLFLRYDRYDKNRSIATLTSIEGQEGALKKPVADVKPIPSKPLSQPSSLIEFNNDRPVTSASAAAASVPLISTNMQAMNLNNSSTREDDFDMFAQSRTVTYESSKQSAAPYGDPDQVEASLGKVAQQRQQEGGLLQSDVLQGVKEEDIQEMEAWLERNKSGEAEDGDSTLSPAMKDYLQKRAVQDPAKRKPDDEPSLFSL